jgi:hypothetical protein
MRIAETDAFGDPQIIATNQQPQKLNMLCSGSHPGQHRLNVLTSGACACGVASGISCSSSILFTALLSSWLAHPDPAEPICKHV